MTLPAIPVLVHIIIKLFVLLGLAMYALFAAVMVRQSQLMDKVIEETFEPILRVLVVLHLVGALVILGLAFITL